MIIKQLPNGKDYVARPNSTRKSTRNRNWFIVKYHKGKGRVCIGNVIFPKEFIGKKVRFQVEVIE